MSAPAVHWAIRQTDLPPRAFMTLVLLADVHNVQNGCFPSHAFLAGQMGCSESVVNDTLKQLENAGKLKRVRRHSRSGHRLTTRYILAFEEEQEASSAAPCDDAAAAAQISAADAENQPRNSGDGPTPEITRNHPRNSGDKPRKITCKEEEEEAREAPNPDQVLLRDVLEAVGLNPDAVLPSWWRGPPAESHVCRWRDGLGLTVAEIIETVEATRQDHPEPPDGPKALDRAMERRARAKAAQEKPKAKRPRGSKPAGPVAEKVSDDVALAQIAEVVNSGRYLPPNAISNGLAARLLAAGLVTPDRLRERGLGFLIPDGALGGGNRRSAAA